MRLAQAIRIMCSALLLAPLACTTVTDYPYMTEGQPHAEAIVAAIAREWKAEELIKNADPRMLEAFPEAKIKELVATCSRDLGTVKRQQTVVSSTGVGVGSPSGKFAQYLIELECEKATARVTINLQKVKERWGVVGFWVNIQGAGGKPSQSPASIQ